MHSDPSVVALVTRAAEHDQTAWEELVERYLPLVWAICARYQLRKEDADDVSQSVFMVLLEQLDKLREPAALPGWLRTTTRNECLRVLRIAGRYDLSDREPDDVGGAGIEEEIITAERNAALRSAFADLSPKCRELLSWLFCEEPLSYQEISSMLGVSMGTVGPQRKRCLEELRRSPHLAAYIAEGTGIPIRNPEVEPHA
jgi:RNA polymerase sigma factor (sigma-70 family)